MGKGLGYIDVHLLASAVLTGFPPWTLDKKLKKAAEGSIASIDRSRVSTINKPFSKVVTRPHYYTQKTCADRK